MTEGEGDHEDMAHLVVTSERWLLVKGGGEDSWVPGSASQFAKCSEGIWQHPGTMVSSLPSSSLCSQEDLSEAISYFWKFLHT